MSSENQFSAPFGLDGGLDQERLNQYLKRDLNNLLSSYSADHDVLSELLQNAVDAIQFRGSHELSQSTDGTTDYTGELHITLSNRADDKFIIVSDNGIGMTLETLNQISIKGFSEHKSHGQTIGHKGVGSTFLITQTDFWQCSSKANSQPKATISIVGARSWLNSTSTPQPKAEQHSINLAHHSTTTLGITEQGTTIRLSAQHIKLDQPRSQSIEDQCHAMMNFLACTTAVGQVHIARTPFLVSLTYINSTGEIHQLQMLNNGRKAQYTPNANEIAYPLPHRIPTIKALDTRTIPPPNANPQRALSFNSNNSFQHDGIYRTWDKTQLLELRANQESISDEYNFKDNIEQVYAFLSYSTEVLKKQIKSQLRTRIEILQYGLRLAPHGVPQGRKLDLKLTSNIGLERQAHVVIVTKGSQLDTGRKLLANEREQLFMQTIATQAINILKNFRGYLKPNNKVQSSDDLQKWKEETKHRAQGQPSTLFDPFLKSSKVTICRDEQEVIVAFTSLCSSRWLNNIEIHAASGHNTYDALVEISPPLNDNRQIQPETLNPAVLDSLLVCEFKLSFGQLLADFHNAKKESDKINICICWSCAKTDADKFDLGSIQPTYGQWKNEREIPGQTHLWRGNNGHNIIYVIALENLLYELYATQNRGPVPKLSELMERDRSGSTT